MFERVLELEPSAARKCHPLQKPGNEKFPILELRVAGVSGWENSQLSIGLRALALADSVDLTGSQPLVIALQGPVLEDLMLFRSYFLHYRLIREAITAIATLGAALLFSYLILQA